MKSGNIHCYVRCQSCRHSGQARSFHKYLDTLQPASSKRLRGLSILPYTKRLAFLGIDSLELRRLRYDLVFVYKMLFGLVDLKFSDYFTLRANSSSTTRGNDYKLFQTYSRLNVRKHFFCERVVHIWNNLEYIAS